MISKLRFIIFISIFIQIFSKLFSTDNDNKAGVKIALKQDLILDFQKKYLPRLLEKIGNINIPNQEINIDAKIGTLHIYLTDINFSITNLSAENIAVKFNDPNIVQVSANQVTGNGSLHVRFKLGFISETDRVNVNVKRLDVTVTTVLNTIESKLVPNKLIPSCSITDIGINLDFDFDIHGSLIAAIAGLVKSKIKNLINDQIQNNLKNSIKNTLNDLINENVNKLPVYIPFGHKGFDLSIDYSLVSNPKVVDNYLILNSYGAVVNQYKPESMNIPFSLPENLPEYNKEGKLAQVFTSDFSLKTAVRTAHLTNLLSVTIDSNMIPKDSPIQFNTTSLDLLIHGFLDVYGKDKLVKFDCLSYMDFPNVTISENEIIADLNAFCSIFVEIDNSTNFDKAIDFKTSVNAKASAILTEGGNITATIQTLNLDNTEFVYSKLPNVDAKRFEQMVNFSSRLIVPFLNQKYLEDLSVNIPSVDGIYFDDSKLDIRERYIEINLTPKVTLSYFEEKEKMK